MPMVHYESYQEKDNMQLKVLDENGNNTDVLATKKEVHEKHLWHQEASLFVINESGKILLQKRSNHVHYNNRKWGMIANHVGADQSLIDAIRQKALEEIGYDFNPSDIRYLTMLKRNEEREQRFTYFYYIKTNIKDEDIKLNDYLATEKRWFDFEELQELMLMDSEEVVFKNTPEYLNIFGELSKIVQKDRTDIVIKEKQFLILNTSDGCYLPAVLQHSTKKTESIIIFIHGSGGNFFKENWYHDMFQEFNYQGYDFLISNNRGSEQFFRLHRKTGGSTETIKAGNIYEDFADSVYDVDAAVNYAKEEGYKDIILVGQSLGTLKVQNYCERVGGIDKVILLSPIDMIQRFRSRVKEKYNELVEQSKRLVAEGKKYEMVTSEFSAIKIVSTMAIGSNADLFKLEENRDISKPLNYKGQICIIAGSNEHVYAGWTMDYVEQRFKEIFQNASFQFYIIPNATHDYKEHEKQMARLIIDSIKKMKSKHEGGLSMTFQEAKTPEELYLFMDEHIKYGYKDDEGTVFNIWSLELSSTFQEALLKSWRVSTADKLIEKGYGQCWDQTEIEREWFEKNGYTYKTFLTYYNGPYEYPCHIFLTYKDEITGEWVWFEHSSEPNCGIHHFETLDELLIFQRDRSFLFANEIAPLSEKAKASYRILNFSGLKEGMTMDETFDHVFINGIDHVFGAEEKKK